MKRSAHSAKSMARKSKKASIFRKVKRPSLKKNFEPDSQPHYPALSSESGHFIFKDFNPYEDEYALPLLIGSRTLNPTFLAKTWT
jgi:hypothetical protein